MIGIKKLAYSTRRAEVVQLEEFDYMIATYSYFNGGYDLDSATHFANTGTIEDTKIIGCGQTMAWSGDSTEPYITPTMTTPINQAYLYQHGDDSGDGLGESILINFKNLELSGISQNNDVQVELYAGWCSPPDPAVANITITTYVGGTLTITNNIITSNGTVINQFTNSDIPVLYLPNEVTCCSSPISARTHVGTVYYNLVTKIATVTFY
jgi:hypothetical protein